MSKIIRIDMTNEKITWQNVPNEYKGLGGRGLTSTIIAKEVNPTCNPIGPLNKLIFAPGLLAGTICANSGRISVGAKSPLTNTIKESNSGGQIGHYLAKLDIAAIIIEGAAKEGNLFILLVSNNKVELKNANYLRGLGNYATITELSKIYGSQEIAFCSIGQAGEYKLTGASIAFTDLELKPSRHAGRGGLGAVMGSKGIKAIIVDQKQSNPSLIANQEAFKKAAKEFAKALTEHPVTSKGLPTYGTSILINILNEAGGLPTRNFSTGRFEKAENVSGESLNKITIERGGNPTHGCMTGCVIRCSGTFLDQNGKYVSKWPEYETIWAWGPNCGIDDLDIIAHIDYMCDDYGLDTIETGCAMAVAMEAKILNFGDGVKAKQLLEEVSQGTPFGRILGSGAAVLGQIFGISRVAVVKKQSIPAYDPRAVKGIGVTYATSPMGADHTAGYSVTANILGIGGKVNPLKTEGQIALSKALQIATAVIDNAGLCLFVAFAILDMPIALLSIINMINAKNNLTLSNDDLNKIGTRILASEKKFNIQAGFNNGMDRLPDFLTYEKLPPHNTTFDITNDDLDTTLNF